MGIKIPMEGLLYSKIWSPLGLPQFTTRGYSAELITVDFWDKNIGEE